MAQTGAALWRQLFDAGDISAATRDRETAGEYQTATSRLLAQRVPLASALFAFFVGNASLLEWWYYPARRPVLIAVCAAEALVCVLHVWIVRVRPALVWPATILASVALAACISTYFAVTGGNAEMHAIGLTLFLAGLAVVYPWGARGQVLAGAGIAFGYAAALVAGANAHLPMAYGLFALITAATLMTLGAQLLEQHRWLAFRHAAELRRVNELQRQEADFSRALLDLTEALNVALHDPRETARQLTNHVRDTLGVEFASTYLLDDARQVFRMVAISGPYPDLIDEIQAVEIERGTFPLHAALERDGLVEIVDREAQELVPTPLLERWRVRSLLVATIARGPHLIGTLMGGYAERRGPFTPMQHRLLKGMAQHAAVALENARLMETAREANRIKSEFVATMSHELRTPLNVILGYTDLLVEGAMGDLSAEQDDALRRVRTRSLHLLDLIQDTLDLNRLESGQVPLTIEDFSVGEVLQSVRSNVPMGWRRPGVRLDWDSAQDHIVLRSDRAKVEMIVRNLVHNALKYTERGAVSVSVTNQPTTGAVEFNVTDTGPGIPPEEIPRIFEMFQQANGTSYRREGGVGLGLYIVRRLIEALGGTVSVESEVGHGSRFTVSLPLRPVPGLSLHEPAG
jgi:signal transduction histidine kinase